VKTIRALALDVDGVLTDGGVWWGPDGAEWKRFDFRDVMGVSRGRRAGLVLALISGEDSSLVDRFATKMGIEHVYKGCRDKAAALRRFAEECGWSVTQVAFMGDDINDVEAMTIAGLSASPCDGHGDAQAAAAVVTRAAGGHGAVREFVDGLLADMRLGEGGPSS
jgi:3-deoxy-D-manno-octulosonate 8-phosphate phosphatase (KDO 8-P phosphatase)